MAERWYLVIDGIEGASRAQRFERAIEVDTYSWGLTAGGPSPGSGRARGRTQPANLAVTAAISAASPQLIDACATQRQAATATLSGVRDHGVGRADAFLRYELTDVTVVGVQHGDDPATTPTERIELAYATIRISYTPQDDRGGLGEPVVADVRR